MRLRVGVVGVGKVGSMCAAHLLAVLPDTVQHLDLLLIDKRAAVAAAVAIELADYAAVTHRQSRAFIGGSGPTEAGVLDYVVLAAQVMPMIGGRRIRDYGELLKVQDRGDITSGEAARARLAAVRELLIEIQELIESQTSAVWVVVSNPVNAICARLHDLGLPADRVFGAVDVDRARRQAIAPPGVEISVYGNHGGTVIAQPGVGQSVEANIRARVDMVNRVLGGTALGAAAAAARTILWHAGLDQRPLALAKRDALGAFTTTTTGESAGPIVLPDLDVARKEILEARAEL